MARTHVQQSQISGSLIQDTFDNYLPGPGLQEQGTLVGDLNALRSQIRQIMGSGASSWTDSATQDLSDIYTAVRVTGKDTALQGALSVTDGSSFGGAVAMNSSLSVAGAATLSDALSVTGAATMGSSLSVTGAATLSDTLYVGSNATINGTLTAVGNATMDSELSVVGATHLNDLLTVAGTATIAGDILGYGKISANNAADAPTYLYVVGTNGEISASNFVTANQGVLNVVGAITASTGIDITGGGLSVAGDVMELTAGTSLKIDDLVQNQILFPDVNHKVTQSADLTFDGTDFKVGNNFDVVVSSGDVNMNALNAGPGYFAGNVGLTGDLSVNNNATIGGALSVTQAAYISDTLSVSSYATIYGALKLHGNSIQDSADQQVLAFQSVGGVADSVSVDHNLEVLGDNFIAVSGSFSGDLSVAGDLLVQGTMTTIDTENLKVKDALIHLNAGGSSGVSPRGIVLHGDMSFDDLAFGAGIGSGDFVFAKEVPEIGIDSTNPDVFSAAKLAAAWMSGVKFGTNEGAANLSGSLSVVGDDMKLVATNELLLKAKDAAPVTFVSGSAESTAFFAQFPGMSLIAAVTSAASGGNFKQGSFQPGAVVHGTPIPFNTGAGGSLRTGDLASEKAMDVYLNGVRLAYSWDFTINSATSLKLVDLDTTADDILTVVIHNAAAV